MKTRELSLGEKQVVLKHRKERKSIMAIALGMACSRTWNVLGQKETADVLCNRHPTSQSRKTTAADDGNIVRAVKKYRGYTTRCKPHISSKIW